ncbi:MAG: hypothetical protein ACE5NP_11825 [Anaerolineae bacterium]
MRIAIVGPCASGKSVLVQQLRQLGYDARHCAQEHSYVLDMWRVVSKPDRLIFLDADLPSIRGRRRIDWGEKYLSVQRRRLSHAREHCDLYIVTDQMTEEQILQTVLDYLAKGQRNNSALSTRCGGEERSRGHPSCSPGFAAPSGEDQQLTG